MQGDSLDREVGKPRARVPTLLPSAVQAGALRSHMCVQSVGFMESPDLLLPNSAAGWL